MYRSIMFSVMLFRSIRIAVILTVLLTGDVNLAQEFADRTEEGVTDSSVESDQDWENGVEEADKILGYNEEAKNRILRKFVRKKIFPNYKRKRYDSSRHFFPNYHTVKTCEVRFKFKDLGINRYPRYIKVGVCKTDTCDKNEHCSEKKYDVWILRQKFEEETADNGNLSFLPKALRSVFVFEVHNVTVACQCVTNFD